MKSVLALLLCLVLVAISGSVLAGGYKRPYMATDKEEFYGTWVNMDYTSRAAQKIVYNPDGTGWSNSDAKAKRLPTFKLRYLITAKWSDQEGNIWYKSHWVNNYGEQGFSLIKISNSANTLEYVFDFHEYPTEIDPEDDYYRIYYRK